MPYGFPRWGQNSSAAVKVKGRDDHTPRSFSVRAILYLDPRSKADVFRNFYREMSNERSELSPGSAWQSHPPLPEAAEYLLGF